MLIRRIGGVEVEVWRGELQVEVMGMRAMGGTGRKRKGCSARFLGNVWKARGEQHVVGEDRGKNSGPGLCMISSGSTEFLLKAQCHSQLSMMLCRAVL